MADCRKKRTISAFGLLVLLVVCLEYSDAGKWVVGFKTSNNWMAGFVGDVSVCLTLRSVKPVIPKLGVADHNDTTEAGDSSNLPTLDPEDASTDDLAADEADPTTTTSIKEECQPLPWRNFERGKPYLFGLDYVANGNKVDRARIFAKPLTQDTTSKCQSADVWHIDEITFQNLESGQLFEKKSANNNRNAVKPMLLEARCSGVKDLVLESFVVSLQKRPCIYDSAIYKDGESFEDGCSAACRCQDGGIACVSRCPPSLAPNCREVYVPGQCCPTFACEKIGVGASSSKFSSISCPMYENNDCETANRTVDPGEYPWTAFIKLCSPKGCKRFCSGALVNEQWLLSAADCFLVRSGRNDVLISPDDVRVIVGEHTLILAEDRDVEIAVQNITLSSGKAGGNGGLALLKLKEPVVFDRAVQPATLPTNREQCQVLTQPSCALSLAGWINIGAAENEQYELYKISTRIEDQRICGPVHHQTAPQSSSSNVLPSSRKRKPLPPPPSSASSSARDNSLCIDLANDDPVLQPECGACSQQAEDINSTDSSCFGDKNAYLCTGEKGRTLVSKVQVPSPVSGSVEVNYLVGLISYDLSAQETTANVCRKPAYRLALGVCQDLDWISATINESD